MKKAVILVEKDFQDMEVLYPYYRLKEAGIDVKLIGTGAKNYSGKYGYPVKVDGNINNYNNKIVDLVVIPGGWAPDYLRRNKDMVNFVKNMNKKRKLIASICHGASLLVSADIIKGKKMTCYYAVKDDVVNAGAKYFDKEVMVDGNLITSRNPDDLPSFMKEILKKLK